jgi:hypothetical protein
MAIPLAAAMIPWKQIIVYAPEVVKAARLAWGYWQSNPKKPPIDPAESVGSQVGAIRARIERLEDNEAKQAEIISRIADQLEGIAAGLEETAGRQRVVLALAAVAAVTAIVALAVVLLR